LNLVEATYHRIRLIQACMGYHNLLPLPNDPANNQVCPTTWTRHQALEALTTETRDLMEEFDISYGGNDESLVMVEAL